MPRKPYEPKVAFAKQLRLIAADPMWADHCEIRKTTLRDAAALIQKLANELYEAQKEASDACASLSTLALEEDAEHAIRDAKQAAHTLCALQGSIQITLHKLTGDK